MYYFYQYTSKSFGFYEANSMVLISPFPLPETLQGLSPEWLTLVLRQSGVLQSSCVQSVDILAEALGNGMAAQISRLGLQYDRDETGQPRTLVVKRPAVDMHLRGFFESIGCYQREAFFYNNIAGKLRTPSPRCYFASYTREPQNMILLLEDLDGYDFGDWAMGVTLERARIILREMALLHAAWWMSPTLDEIEILLHVNRFDHSHLDQDFAAQWPAALEVLGLGESDAYRAICKRLEGKIEPAFLLMNNPPLTLSHLDFHMDNMVFGRHPDQAPFMLLDWALLGEVNPTFDLAYFICQNLDTPLRQAHEQELIGEYLGTLAENGVQDFDLEICMQAYRSVLLPILQRNIAAIYSQLPLTVEQARQRRIVLTRLLDAVIDHN
jgi:hypothetical protein